MKRNMIDMHVKSAPQGTADSAERVRNRIIKAWPSEVQDDVLSQATRVTLGVKTVLFDVDRPIEYAYFPEDCVVSTLAVLSDGSAIETATIGCEGMVGLPLFLGTDRTAAQAFVQVPGSAWRLDADAFRRLLAESEQVRSLVGRYTQALFTQVTQLSACNRRHAVPQRCARWLLQTHDRVTRDEFPLTHQFLSQMLGVRRATVTEVASELQRRGYIEYAYGKVAVRNRAGLESAACECYDIIRREFDRLVDGRDVPLQSLPSTMDANGLSTVRDGVGD